MHRMVMSVRRARSEDWSQLWPLLVAMGAPEGEVPARDRFLRLVGDASWLIVVAADQSGLAGYAAAQDYGEHLRCGKEGRIARLHDVYVAESHRRGGVGRQLMDDVVQWASTRVGYLQWQAHESRSAPFYERLGFRGVPCPQPDYPEFEVAF
jgi:GNAT superfamily N-acetyltransferase